MDLVVAVISAFSCYVYSYVAKTKQVLVANQLYTLYELGSIHNLVEFI